MPDHCREGTDTTISRRALLVRGGLLGLLAFVAPSLLAADDAEAGHGGKRRRAVKVKHRGFKRHRGFKKHARFAKRRGFNGHVRFKKHARFKRHRGVKVHARFGKRPVFNKHRGFRKVRVVRFKKRW